MTPRTAPRRKVHRVLFQNQGQVYEIYARSVDSGSMLGFVEVVEPLFGEKSALVVDPSEERLRTEFAGVLRFLVPIHSVIRIDEVEKEGTSRIAGAAGAKGEGNVTLFPTPTPPPRPAKG